jgi:hypothetical protein
MAYAGILVDYHIIFMILSFGLFFISLFLVWMVNTKQSIIVSIFLLGLNPMFILSSAWGFMSIGIIGYDSTLGQSTVIPYPYMFMFTMMFMALLWLNGLVLFIALIKYNKKAFRDYVEDKKALEY